MKTAQTKETWTESKSMASALNRTHAHTVVTAQQSPQVLIDNSPRQTAQGKFLAQLQKDAGRKTGILPAQCLQEDKTIPMQGKFETAQLLDDDLVQNKIETAQREGDDDKELLQPKFDIVQREDLDEKLSQAKFDSAYQPLQAKFSADTVAQRLEEPDSQPNKTGMPDNLKNGVESLSGMSMNDVRVHYNSDKPAQLNALAYAQGSDIHVAPGQEQHLPHEAWHVVQQAQGRVQPTMQMRDSMPVNDDPGLEYEADIMGGKALLNSEHT